MYSLVYTNSTLTILVSSPSLTLERERLIQGGGVRINRVDQEDLEGLNTFSHLFLVLICSLAVVAWLGFIRFVGSRGGKRISYLP